MTHLRTDLPLIPDQEMDEWVEDILENTHYRDLKALRQKLDEAIHSYDTGLTPTTITKKCDKCDKTYPDYVDKCQCGNTNLGTFELNYSTN